MQSRLRRGEARVERGDLVAQGSAAGEQVVGAVAGALAARDLLRAGVARGLALLDVPDERAPVAFELVEAVQDRGVRGVRAAAP